MEFKAGARPRITMRITTDEVCKLVERRPLVVGAEEHFACFGNDPAERMRWFTARSRVVVNAYPLKFALGTRRRTREQLEGGAPLRPSGSGEAAHGANLEGEIERPLGRLGPTPGNLDAIHAAHWVTLSVITYAARISRL